MCFALNTTAAIHPSIVPCDDDTADTISSCKHNHHITRKLSFYAWSEVNQGDKRIMHIRFRSRSHRLPNGSNKHIWSFFLARFVCVSFEMWKQTHSNHSRFDRRNNNIMWNRIYSQERNPLHSFHEKASNKHSFIWVLIYIYAFVQLHELVFYGLSCFFINFFSNMWFFGVIEFWLILDFRAFRS